MTKRMTFIVLVLLFANAIIIATQIQTGNYWLWVANIISFAAFVLCGQSLSK